MLHFIAVVVLSSVTTAQSSAPQSAPAPAAVPQTPGSQTPGSQTSGSLPNQLPAVPKGRSTVMGGTIRSVDAVRDQIVLKVYGGRPVKILFDERTQVYRDGKRIPLHDLRPEDHASVETLLDGTNVFALSIRMLSKSPEGESEGKILSYDPATGDLTISDALSQEPIQLRVPPGTVIVRQGQAADPAATSAASTPGDSTPGDDTDRTSPGSASDLSRGTLISVSFQSDNNGRGTVHHVAILATPGAAFVFNGTLTFLDLHARALAVSDAVEGKTYRIAFDPDRFPVSHDLHTGQSVQVTATYDGSGYTATAIAAR